MFEAEFSIIHTNHQWCKCFIRYFEILFFTYGAWTKCPPIWWDTFKCTYVNENCAFCIKVLGMLFQWVRLTKSKLWFRKWLGAEQATSHYLNQCWSCALTHICVNRRPLAYALELHIICFNQYNWTHYTHHKNVTDHSIYYPYQSILLTYLHWHCVAWRTFWKLSVIVRWYVLFVLLRHRRHSRNGFLQEDGYMLNPNNSKKINRDLGPVSIPDKTSYCKISWSLEAARFIFKIAQSLWNLTGTSAAVLPRCLPNFKAMR